jgi:NAD(P)-dependent dehydrogenase (short-subunit alcohol dehydrogenase family)
LSVSIRPLYGAFVVSEGGYAMTILKGRVAVITGATSGIGACTARLFVAEGAKVAMAGRRYDRGVQMAEALGQSAMFVQTDVSVEADVKAMIERAVGAFGRLDCLINSAGAGSKYAGIAEVDLDEFDKTIAVHLRGVLTAMKYAVPVMASQGAGSIVTIASINGTRAGLGGHYYSAAKAAAIHLARCAAMELGEKGIRVNTISPGPIATGIFAKGAGLDPNEADANPEFAEAALAAVLPRWQALPHVGRAEDVAQAALYLASDASRSVTGHDLVTDGGITAGWPISATREDMALFRKALQTRRPGRPMENTGQSTVARSEERSEQLDISPVRRPP